MNRCALLATTALVAIAPMTASAQWQVQPGVRAFPPGTLRGLLEVQQGPEVLLNGQPARLSPGSRIRAANNMQVLSGALTGQKLVVHYTLEQFGMLHNVWVLTPQEQAVSPWPTTPEEAQRWLYDPLAQTWQKR